MKAVVGFVFAMAVGFIGVFAASSITTPSIAALSLELDISQISDHKIPKGYDILGIRKSPVHVWHGVVHYPKTETAKGCKVFCSASKCHKWKYRET